MHPPFASQKPSHNLQTSSLDIYNRRHLTSRASAPGHLGGDGLSSVRDPDAASFEV